MESHIFRQISESREDLTGHDTRHAMSIYKKNRLRTRNTVMFDTVLRKPSLCFRIFTDKCKFRAIKKSTVLVHQSVNYNVISGSSEWPGSRSRVKVQALALQTDSCVLLTGDGGFGRSAVFSAEHYVTFS